jgi:hypothetical protein
MAGDEQVRWARSAFVTRTPRINALAQIRHASGEGGYAEVRSHFIVGVDTEVGDEERRSIWGGNNAGLTEKTGFHKRRKDEVQRGSAEH